MNDKYYCKSNDSSNYIIIRELEESIVEELKEKINGKKDKKNILVFDFWNINDIMNEDDFNNLIQECKPESLIIKHCRFPNELNLYINLDLKELYITDELYSISPILDSLSENFKAKKLYLKKLKINSKLQLKSLFEFIKSIECEELILDDLFIELLIKENEEDTNFDELEYYITFENGKFIMNYEGEGKKDKDYLEKLKKLKLIDSQIFFIPDEFIKGKIFPDKINNEIYIDIDENSILNPNIITKFKIKDGLIDICFDLDSYKINIDDNKDYLEYLNYIFDLIINNKEIFRKIKFKNFDMTKLEYIIDNNYEKDRENIILNEEEQNRKTKFNEFYGKLLKKIGEEKLNNIKEIIFDNCTNYFIELILSMVKSDLDLLKIKKCAKDKFNLKNIIPLNITHFYLFDTPIIIPEDFKENVAKSENKLTLKIVSLEHYCLQNNIDSYQVLEDIEKFVIKTNRKIICFEMNALPMLMKYIILSNQLKNDKEVDISKEIKRIYFIDKYKGKNEDRDFKLFNKYKDCLKAKKIILRKNNIKNKLEHLFFLKKVAGDLDKNKDNFYDYGKENADLDEDYKNFFNLNEIKEIEFENCLFSNYDRLIFHKAEINNKLEKNEKDTIKNFISGDNNNENNKVERYIFDMKTLKEILFKNNHITDFSLLMKICKIYTHTGRAIDEHKKHITKFFEILKYLFSNSKIIITLNNIKEQKEFYCLLCIYIEIDKIDNNNNDINKDIVKKIYQKIKKYFIEEENEEKNIDTINDDIKKLKKLNEDKIKDENKIENKVENKIKDENKIEEKIKNIEFNEPGKICTIFNYYYSSKEEEEIFKNCKPNEEKEVSFKVDKKNEYKFKIKYNVGNPYEIIYN